jgi:hypothetical protein
MLVRARLCVQVVRLEDLDKGVFATREDVPGRRTQRSWSGELPAREGRGEAGGGSGGRAHTCRPA